jgi:ELWxxDGT repeat protein
MAKMKGYYLLLFIFLIIIQQSNSAIPQNPNLVKDISINSVYQPGSNPEVFCHIGDISFFVAYTREACYELWRTNGTDSGTFMLADITPGEGGYYLVNGFAIGNNKLYFISSDPMNFISPLPIAYMERNFGNQMEQNREHN